MDIELLSKMVGDLIVRHDQVGLPGVGTFVAEMVPASFSDKGYTINPPYRRLTFCTDNREETLLIDFYASANHLSRETAGLYITQYLAELRSVLEQRKSITLPGLGRLRATRENHLFFVADEALDIVPGGIGLRPVSLKSHLLEDDPVVIRVQLPVRPEVPDQVRNDGERVRNDGQVASEVIPAEEPESAAAEPEAPAAEPESAAAATETVPPAGKARREMPSWLLLLLVIVILAALFLGGFMLLAYIAPDMVDSILYTPDELRILKY